MASHRTMGWLVTPNLKTKLGSGNNNLCDFYIPEILNAFKCELVQGSKLKWKALTLVCVQT